MSLTLSLNNALSGLRASQRNLSVISQNVSNANTEGYSRQTVAQSGLYLNQVGSGVRIDDVTREVDKYIQRSLQGQGTSLGRSEIIDEYMQRTQILLGDPNDDTSVVAQIDNLFNAFQDLADNPDQASIRQTVLKNAEALSITVSGLAVGLEGLRFEADRDILRAVSNLNQQIAALNNVNNELGEARAFADTPVGLLDQRDALIKSISEYLPVRVQEQEDGQVFLYTDGGLSILDDLRYELNYLPAQSTDTFINDAALSNITIQAFGSNGVAIGEPDELVGAGVEGSIDTPLKNGQLLGLLEMRDVEFPKILSTLDELVSTLRDEVNAVHNLGSGFAPATSLTGDYSVGREELRDWSGVVRIAALDVGGNPLPNPFDVTPTSIEQGEFRPLDLQLDFNSGDGEVGRHSTQTIIDEINAHFGTQQSKVSVGNLNDMKLVMLDENTPAPSLPLEFDFEFENISEATAQVEVVGVTINGGPLPVGSLPGGGAGVIQSVPPGTKYRTGLDFSFESVGAGPFVVDVQVQVTNADTGVVSNETVRYNVNTAIADQKNNRIAANALIGAGDGVITAPTSVGPFLVAELVDEDGNLAGVNDKGFIRIRAADEDIFLAADDLNSQDNGENFGAEPVRGTERGLLHYFGINNFFKETRDIDGDSFSNAAFNMQVRADILEDSNLLSSGRLTRSVQSTDPSVGATYTYEMGAGDNRVAQAMSDIGLGNISFDDSGILSATGQTFNLYSASFIGAATTNAVFANQNFLQDLQLFEGFEERMASISGVNVDEEMANTVIYQASYTASARVITVTDELLQTLLDSV